MNRIIKEKEMDITVLPKCPLRGKYKLIQTTSEIIIECSIHGTNKNPKYWTDPWWKFWSN